MALFSKPIRTLDDLFTHLLQDIYYAEHQIEKNLPTMVEKATAPHLKAAFEAHLAETRTQIGRLDSVFAMLGQDAKSVTCEAINGILKEAKEVASDIADPDVLDAGLLASAQAIEHYEITRYGTMVALSKRLGRLEVANVLELTLNEEKETDRKLSALAEAEINQKAA